VAKAPRVGQVCAEHATVTTLRLVGGRTLTIAQYVAETDRAPRLRQRLGVLQVGAMTRYTITMPLYLDRVRRGDPIVVGYGGDHPDTVLDKLLASHTTIPPHLGSKELDQVERGWPKSRINEPTEWIVGTVARVRTGRRSR